MIQVSTSDPDEAIAAVSGVYCPHQLQLDRRSRRVATRLRADNNRGFAQIGLEYGARAEVDAGVLDGLILVMHAVRGSGTVRQGGKEEQWRGGQTIAVSGNRPTEFVFDAIFAQSTLRLDPVLVREHCESLLGLNLDSNVRFELTHFSPELESLWSQILTMSSHRSTLPPSGLGYLQQLAMDLLLYRLPHNYSHLLTPECREVRSLADEAIGFIDSLQDYELLTVADVAAKLRVSVRSLERAFRDSQGMGPAQFLRIKRLDRVRRQLEAAGRTSSITDVAAAHGFFHPGRFAQYYRERFGESPSTTIAKMPASQH